MEAAITVHLPVRQQLPMCSAPSPHKPSHHSHTHRVRKFHRRSDWSRLAVTTRWGRVGCTCRAMKKVRHTSRHNGRQ